jgi:hypothetical protein
MYNSRTYCQNIQDLKSTIERLKELVAIDTETSCHRPVYADLRRARLIFSGFTHCSKSNLRGFSQPLTKPLDTNEKKIGNLRIT